jgi:hypothetical protein
MKLNPETYSSRIVSQASEKPPQTFRQQTVESTAPRKTRAANSCSVRSKYMKRPTAMVVFPRETHELSRSGEPWHRVERLEHVVNWFDK